MYTEIDGIGLLNACVCVWADDSLYILDGNIIRESRIRIYRLVLYILYIHTCAELLLHVGTYMLHCRNSPGSLKLFAATACVALVSCGWWRINKRRAGDPFFFSFFLFSFLLPSFLFHISYLLLAPTAFLPFSLFSYIYIYLYLV